MSLSVGDPLALLALQSGVVPTPSTGGRGSDPLTADQRSASLGDPIPVVWARWRNGAGGVLLSPPATEVRWENDARNRITASYHLLLGEGPISAIEVRDVFSGAVRKGSFNQTYNRRAGTWLPGNFITNLNTALNGRWFITDTLQSSFSIYDFNWYPVTYEQVTPDGPYFERYKINGISVRPTLVFTIDNPFKIPSLTQYCGSVGTYPGCSTLSFQIQSPPEDDTYLRQVNIFIRGGVNILRLADGIYGPSDNFADLILWLMRQSSKITEDQIDLSALTSTALFLERQGFTCNCVITETTSLDDLIASWGPYFLVTESRNNGRRGLRPVLPTDNTGNILTGPLTPAYRFTLDNIDPDSFEISYTPLSTRQPFVVQARWRQQPVNDLGIDRVLETRFAGTADNGPYELHDLSQFATSENHVAKVSAYLLSRRLRIEHTARWTARHGNHATTVAPGSLVRLTLTRETVDNGTDTWDYLYVVDRISKGLSGAITYECTHLPVNNLRQSLVAQDVVAAVGTGIILPVQRTGINQDVNSSTDSSVPEDQGINQNDSATQEARNAGEEQTIENNTEGSAEAPPLGPEDGPGDPQQGPDRDQLNTDTPARLTPIACDTGRPPYKTEWWYKKIGGEYKLQRTTTEDYNALSRTPILPLGPGAVIGDAEIITTGAKYYAKYYCPKVTDTTDAEKTALDNIRYSREYTVTPSDLAPFQPLGNVEGGKSVAYRLRILRNDGLGIDPYYWDEAPNNLVYHSVVYSAGQVTGFQNGIFDYYYPGNPAHNSLGWMIRQGPSVVGYDIVEFYIGPTADLASGTMLSPPVTWNAFTWDANGNIIPKP